MHNIYISPNGNDDHPGTQEQPLQTLASGRDHVRKLLRERRDDVVVHLSPGEHRLTETLVLGHEDAVADVSVTWQGQPGTQIASGYALEGWQRCDHDLPDVPAPLQGRVWYIDLPSGTVVNTLYNAQGSLPRARGAAIQPQPKPIPVKRNHS